VVRGLRDAGFCVAPGERFRLRSAPAVRVTVASLPEREAKALADAMAHVLRPPRRTLGA
jgi:hypothetical protein